MNCSLDQVTGGRPCFATDPSLPSPLMIIMVVKNSYRENDGEHHSNCIDDTLLRPVSVGVREYRDGDDLKNQVGTHIIYMICLSIYEFV